MILRTARLLVLPLALAGAPVFAAPTVSAQVEEAARAQLEKQAAASNLPDARFELTVVPPRVAATCSGPVEVETVDTRQPTRMRFAVRCPGAGATRLEYIVRARISASVVVLAAPVAANEILTDTHVTVEQREITSIPDPVIDPNDAVGQTSRRMLRAGDVLRNNSLSAPVLIKRGDAVVMVARVEGIEVSTAGEALDAGARGATVRVRNSTSGQTVRMRVTGAGTVEPIDMPRASR
ncbi:flagellar basal body P-ring formation chaperone FlgA [Massilia suwonensis]|uniref:Flagella basal body P-ring formation protein FlgA n=1 Tax=Massilia suwonensis TaxID=648895 RepID=A0ABW0MET4_9BURK